MWKTTAALPSTQGDSGNCNFCYHESKAGFILVGFKILSL